MEAQEADLDMEPTWTPPVCRDCALGTVCEIRSAAIEFWIRYHYTGLKIVFQTCIEKLPQSKVRKHAEEG